MGTGKFTSGGQPSDGLASYPGGVEILLVVLCYGNWAKGTLSRSSLHKFKNAKTRFTATETYKHWSSFDKNCNHNASVMMLKKHSITVITPGVQDPNLKKST